MIKFSNLNKIEAENQKTEIKEIKYQGENLRVIQYNNHEFVVEPQNVAILVYLRDEGYLLMESSNIAGYQYFFKDVDNYKGITNFLTVITSQIEENETLNNCVRRKLAEIGIVVSVNYELTLEKSLFVAPTNISVYQIFILELRYNDYKLIQPITDGDEMKKLNKTIKISLGDINEIRSHDLITEYMLTKFKLMYHLK